VVKALSVASGLDEPEGPTNIDLRLESANLTSTMFGRVVVLVVVVEVQDCSFRKAHLCKKVKCKWSSWNVNSSFPKGWGL
jgi:hypothetical protein